MGRKRAPPKRIFDLPIRLSNVPQLKSMLAYFEDRCKTRRMAPSEIETLERLRQLQKKGHL